MELWVVWEVLRFSSLLLLLLGGGGGGQFNPNPFQTQNLFGVTSLPTLLLPED